MAKEQLMQSKKLAGSKPAASTQQYLDIAEIREDIVVLKDGTLRAVLLVSSINFSLKSEDEQNAIIQGYVSFLNSLESPLQIVIQSRKLNIDDYLNRLGEQEKTQTNELLRTQIADYRTFIKELVELGEIMQKKFIVVVPHNPATNKRKGFFARMSEVLSPLVSARLREEQFRQRKKDLMVKVDSVRASLNSMSLTSAMLDTQSLIELYYGAYNPILMETQKLQKVETVRVEA
jgi:type IV secretory pathway VirB4 component